MKTLKATTLTLFLMLISQASHSAPLTEGNIVYQSNNSIREYTPAGQLVQTFQIPNASTEDYWSYGTEHARDIYVLNRSYILVYNGTFTPYLSTFDLTTERWTHRRDPAMWTVNNVSYGGIAANDDYVFVTSMGPNYNSGNGFVRYDLNSPASQGAGLGIGAIDLNLGLDGKLYVLYPGGSPEGRYIKIYDPNTMQQIGYISLTDIFGWTGHRAIAANAAGDIFIADWGGDVQKISPDGTLLAKTTLNVCQYSNCSLNDIDVDKTGRVMATSRDGMVILMDENLQNITSFNTGSGYNGGFASFIGYSLLPITINVDNEMNSKGCVEATDPQGAEIHFSLNNNNPEAVTYHWISSTDDSTTNEDVTGSNSTFLTRIGVDQTASIYASITEPDSGLSQHTNINVCVSDTTPPNINIASPTNGEIIKNGKLDLDLEITDSVDKFISSYNVFLGRSLKLDYPSSGNNRYEVDLKKGSNGDNELVDVTVMAKDASDNQATKTIQVQLK